MEIFFFPNGVTAVLDPEQQPELQVPWFRLFLEWLVSQGIDPTKAEWRMPDGRRARVFHVEAGFNWEILS